MDKLLYQPKNSLINQSFDAKEIEEPLNGDGFGVGWYVPEIDPNPAVFVSVFPAWNNRNLRFLAPKIRSNCFFAHVRAASVGDISEANCHPFTYEKFLFMHNGGIEGFEGIKRAMRARLSDKMYNWVKGQTDSEHFFALFMDKLLKIGENYKLKDIVELLEATISEVNELKRVHKIAEPTYLNVVITDGTYMVGTRYISDPKIPPLTLYYSRGSRYECEDGVCRMVDADPQERAILIVSERLTTMNEEWQKIPDNHFVLVDKDFKVSVRPIKAA